ncbi:MAG TPA: NAD(P)H-binding protein [Puia sp.]|uniref:NAD(P)H-binding protein n=1 Tax=Puia sp. TaxID=2045100 RepID=UPI002CF18C26|nr:NAD(P)H-binding protein [Puia sp.]HVU98062.1 NAD(P)H-binding protein [Puia sp.]
MKYILLGSLGHITKPLAQQLIAKGHQVTIVSSQAAKAAEITSLGATPAIGSVEDIDFLSATFKGADAAYLMIPPKLDANPWKEWIGGVGRKYAQAVKASGMKKLVFLSSIGADKPDGVGPVSGIHLAEEALKTLSGVDVLFLRPAYFYFNLFAVIGLIKQAGIYGNNFGPDRKIVMVHPRDIAAVAAEELLHLSFKGVSVRYIAGDERNSRDIAAVLGAAIGKPELPYVPFSDEDTEKGMIAAGLPEEVAKNYTEMGVAARTGIMFEDYQKHRPALSPTQLEDFAKEFAAVYNS